MLLRAHRSIAGADGLADFYQANPQAWQDVRHLYEGYVADHRDAVTERINYAKLALATLHPEIAQKQLDDLKPLAADPILRVMIAAQARDVAAALRKSGATQPAP